MDLNTLLPLLMKDKNAMGDKAGMLNMLSGLGGDKSAMLSSLTDGNNPKSALINMLTKNSGQKTAAGLDPIMNIAPDDLIGKLYKHFK